MLVQGTLDEANNVVIPTKPTVWVGSLDGGGGTTGEVTVTNFPATQPVSGSVGVNNFPATQVVSGAVSVSNLPATQPVSGPITNAQMVAITGTAAQTAMTVDPTAAGQTMLAVLRGILAEMQIQTGLLEDIKTNTTV